ncbi:hypothetical protein QLL95_gp0784 [Cotonvirus japonicus]|uniref:CDAN1-interacting nuclease 1 n=1 Tax=Cotonvirus japonicus TaxID=2811091 RepID=A0ABM7NT85_9VIRU|nr:hypothetical protein QLL95_gp0784 [Cotonvirus japonicus]BCS83339.1 hypothetical protein [Cotonvirus japonicus]
MKKLSWYNYRIYNSNTIKYRTQFIKNNINYYLPLSQQEKLLLKTYAKNNNDTVQALLTLRNIIRIQNEIVNNHKYKQDIPRVQKKFIKGLEKLQDQKDIDNFVENFFETTEIPFNITLKAINQIPIFKKYKLGNAKYIKNLTSINSHYNQKVHERSKRFEISLENYLDYENIKYKTEQDIIREKLYNLTPDILLEEPILITTNDAKKQKVNWIDAKNYTLINIPFIIKNLKKQAQKYNNTFGNGAFVFHYGFDESVNIPDTIILDGSFLDKYQPDKQ